MDKISTLMDGELDADDAAAQVARLRGEELRRGWDTYHVIRDTLRGEPVLSAGFNDRLAARLASEPTVLAPRRFAPRPVMRYVLSAAASVSAVAVVAWMALSAGQMGDGPVQVAKVAQPVAPAHVVEMPNDGRMSDYLLAHQGVSPSTAIQGVAQYVRTVSVNSAPRPR